MASKIKSKLSAFQRGKMHGLQTVESVLAVAKKQPLKTGQKTPVESFDPETGEIIPPEQKDVSAGKILPYTWAYVFALF